ncbi:MAG: J domain-containing protein [Terricaulis sp.]
MTDAFNYRPKFVDIRVKPAASGKKRPQRNYDEENSQRRCDHVGCEHAGVHRAPKGREHGNEFWHFCLEHASEYNKRWNYFSGMSDTEVKSFMAKEEVGQRPTWTFRSGRLDKGAEQVRGAKAGPGDAFNLFGHGGAGEPAEAVAPRRRLSRVQAKALEEMHLPENADAAQIRAKYAELVKRWHPDSNGGDRTAEANLHRVLAAYQTLKAAGLV